MSRRRRVLKWLVRGVLGLLLLIIVVTSAVIGWLKTDSGQAFLHARIQEAAKKSLRGTLNVGPIEFSLFSGSVEVKNLTITNEGGQDTLAVEAAAANLSLGALLGGNIVIETVDGTLGAVDVDALMAQLIPSDDPTPDVTVESIRVRGGPIRVAGISVSIEELAASVRIESEVVHAELSALDARVSVDGAPLPVRTKLAGARVDGEVIKADSVELATGDTSRASIQDLAFDAGTGDLAATVALALEPRDLEPWSEWLGVPSLPPTSLTVSVAGALGTRITAKLDGSVAGAAISLDADVFLPARRVAFKLSAQDANLPALWPSLPDGLVSVFVGGEASYRQEALTADIGVFARGQVAGVRSDLMLIGAHIDPEHVSAAALAASGSGGLAVTAHADWSLPNPLPARVRRLRVSGGGLRIEDASADTAPATGLINLLSVDVTGPSTALKTDVHVDAAGIASEGIRARDAVVDIGVVVNAQQALESFTMPRTGTFSVEANGLRQGDTALGTVEAQGTFKDAGRRLELTGRLAGLDPRFAPVNGASFAGTFEQRSTGLVFGLDRLAISNRTGTPWLGRGTVHWKNDGTIAAKNVNFRTPAARLQVDGELPPAGSRREERLHLRFEDIDFAEAVVLAPLGTLPQDLRGDGTIDISLGRHGRQLTSTGSVIVRRFAVAKDTPPLKGTASFDIEPGRSELHARIEAYKTADIEAKVALRTPRNVGNIESWLALDERALLPSRITANADLSHVKDWIPLPIELAGIVDGTVELAPGADEASIEFTLKDGQIDNAKQLSVDIDGTWSEDGMHSDLSVALRGKTFLTAYVAQEQALRSVLRGSYQPTAPIEGAVRVDNANLSELSQSGILVEPVVGTVNVALAVGGTFAAPTIAISNISARNVGVGRARLEAVELAGTVDTQGVDVTLKATERKGCPPPPRKTQRPGTLKLRAKATFQPAFTVEAGSFDADNFDLEILRALAHDETSPLFGAAGCVNAGVTVKGDLETPVLGGELKLDGGRLLLGGGLYRISNLRTRLKHTGDTISVSYFSANLADGEVSGSGHIRVKGFMPSGIDLSMRTRRFPLAVRDIRLSIDLDIKVETEGAGDDGIYDVDVILSNGTVRIDRGREELQPLEDLEDVVFVDEEAQREQAGEGMATPFPPVKLLVKTKRGEPLRVKAEEATLDATVELAIMLRNLVPTSILGPVEVTRGKVTLFEQDYDILVGQVAFDGPVSDPQLSVRIEKDFPAATVTVEVAGRASRPVITLSDDAGHDQLQILGIMNGQDPDDSDDTVQGAELAGAAGAIFGSKVRKQLGRILPVEFDVLRPYPDGVELGEWIHRRVLALYRYRRTDSLQENSHEGRLEWHLTRHVLFEAMYGDRDVGNADFLFIFRF